MLLDDNSGKAVFELLCDVSDPDNPVTAEQSTWPSCLLQPRCTQIPTPDNNATVSYNFIMSFLIYVHCVHKKTRKFVFWQYLSFYLTKFKK